MTNAKDTPTRRYDLMQMRVEEVEGLVSELQKRRVTYVTKSILIKSNSKLASNKSKDEQLSSNMDKLEKLITKMLKDDAAIVKLLNESRGLFFEASDGEIRLDKLQTMETK